MAPPDEARAQQIQSLIAELRGQGIHDERVLAAIGRVPRDRFVPPAFQDHAWENVALPIGAAQTISQPYVVALMTAALNLTETDRVLEIGTGSGYQSAVLAELAADVTSIERQAALARAAEHLLIDLGYRNIAVYVADGSRGWPDGAPFDRIIVTAAAPRVPAPLFKQLTQTGGRLVVPVGSAEEQTLIAVERQGDHTWEQPLGPVRFVPLIGSAGWGVSVDENGHRR
ncbi:MAG: protein-L-isoaspartate(D-aspartate) O-methyltransferase [Thermomicrobiales bacterium]